MLLFLVLVNSLKGCVTGERQRNASGSFTWLDFETAGEKVLASTGAGTGALSTRSAGSGLSDRPFEVLCLGYNLRVALMNQPLVVVKSNPGFKSTLQ